MKKYITIICLVSLLYAHGGAANGFGNGETVGKVLSAILKTKAGGTISTILISGSILYSGVLVSSELKQIKQGMASIKQDTASIKNQTTDIRQNTLVLPQMEKQLEATHKHTVILPERIAAEKMIESLDKLESGQLSEEEQERLQSQINQETRIAVRRSLAE